MAHVDPESVARQFLAAYAAKDLRTIEGQLAADVLLRDWNLEVRGRDAFLAETRRNFDDARSIAIDIERLHTTRTSVAAELVITVDSRIHLRVVDVFDIDGNGLVSAVRSYKGLEPSEDRGPQPSTSPPVA